MSVTPHLLHIFLHETALSLEKMVVIFAGAVYNGMLYKFFWVGDNG